MLRASRTRSSGRMSAPCHAQPATAMSSIQPVTAFHESFGGPSAGDGRAWVRSAATALLRRGDLRGELRKLAVHLVELCLAIGGVHAGVGFESDLVAIELELSDRNELAVVGSLEPGGGELLQDLLLAP